MLTCLGASSGGDLFITTGSCQELALRLGATKLKAAHLIDGDLAEGLGVMDENNDNLLELLMKAVAKSVAGQPVFSREI